MLEKLSFIVFNFLPKIPENNSAPPLHIFISSFLFSFYYFQFVFLVLLTLLFGLDISWLKPNSIFPLSFKTKLGTIFIQLVNTG